MLSICAMPTKKKGNRSFRKTWQTQLKLDAKARSKAKRDKEAPLKEAIKKYGISNVTKMIQAGKLDHLLK